MRVKRVVARVLMLLGPGYVEGYTVGAPSVAARFRRLATGFHPYTRAEQQAKNQKKNRSQETIEARGTCPTCAAPWSKVKRQ